MTRDETINRLESLIKWGNLHEIDVDACRMAIETLEKKPTIEAYKQVCKERDIAIEQLHELGYEWGQKIEPCEDAISRRAVLKLFATHDGKYLFEAIRDLPSVTPNQKQERITDDAISRQAAMRVLDEIGSDFDSPRNAVVSLDEIADAIQDLPSVNPQESKWIPVSEKLPNDRDWYLGIFKESDTGWVNPLPFICDYVGIETKAATKEYWILRGFTDRDYKECDYYYNLECVAWTPLPKPYEPQESEEQE